MNTISFPHSVRFADLCAFSSKIAQLKPMAELQVKTGHVSLFTPTSMIMLAKSCRLRGRQQKGEKLNYFGLNKHCYANNLGFSQALRLKGDPYKQGAFGGKNYLPLSILRRDELVEESQRTGSIVGDVIQRHCGDMALVVSQNLSDSLKKILTSSFTEIFRNVFEHSQSGSAVYCAQYWPTREQVEICIADRGIGFSASLSEDRRFAGLSDREALLFSLMPGVSSKAKAHAKKPRALRSEWDNFGYGLFFAHQLFGSFGKFSIASGQHGITIKNGKLAESVPAVVEGAVVSMRLDLSDVAAIERRIEDIRKLAYEVKARLGVNGLKLSSIEAFFR